LGLLALTGCHSAGQYGYAKTYEPLAEEEAHLGAVTDYDPVMAARYPEDWKNKQLSVFGVVEERLAGANGSAYMRLSVRVLSERNLCDSSDEDTCRVTVSDAQHGILHAEVKLESEDQVGATSVGPGSLLRVIGRLSDTVDKTDGAQVLRAVYYRHWPQFQYVTTADRGNMLR
jgi:hypothetical protein